MIRYLSAWPLRALGNLAVVLSLAACGIDDLNRSESFNPSAVMEAGSDIARTFEEARVYVPPVGSRSGTGVVAGRPGDDRIENALSGRLWPVVLYLHGCTGLQNETPLRELADAGFVVIAPDSFARRFRPLQCRPSRQRGGENIFVYDFRLTELSYALHRLRRAKWVDWRRLYLFGVSEGGVAAALYRGDEFAGRVVAQWTCQGHPFVSGIATGGGEPVLAVVQQGDPWYREDRKYDQRGHCGDYLAGRSGSASYVLQDGERHDVLEDENVRAIIVDFLRKRAMAR